MNNAAAFLVDSSGHPIYKHKTFVQVGMMSGLEGKSLDEVCEWLEDEGYPGCGTCTRSKVEGAQCFVILECCWRVSLLPLLSLV